MRARRLLLILAFSGAALLVRPLFFVLAPGILWVIRPPRREEEDLGQRLALALGVSTAFWLILFWFLKLLSIPFVPVTYGVLGATLVTALLQILLPDPGQEGKLSRRELLLGAALLGTVLLRLLPAWSQLCAPGADMSMHTYLAALTVNQHGVPDSFAPILPFGGVAAYAPGFHCLMALAEAVGGAGPLQAGLFVSCWTYALLGLAIYFFLRRFAGRRASLLGMLLLSFGAPHPQEMFTSGTNPSILSLALAILAGARLLQAGRRWSLRETFTTGLILAACPLAHSLPAVILAYTVLPLGGIALFRLPPEPRRNLLRNGLAVLAGTSLLLTPYLLHLDLVEVSPAEINWAHAWQTQEVWPGGWAGLPAFLLAYGGRGALGLFALSGLLLLLRREGKAGLPLALCGILLLLLLNAQLWWLPLSYGLYPDRVMQTFLVPAAALFALAVQSRLDGASRGHPRRILVPIGAVVLALSTLGFLNHYFLEGREKQGISTADEAAFAWMEEHLPANVMILNNYGDAGLWIPALAKRPAVAIHTSPFFLDEIRKLQEESLPTHLYVGNQVAYKQAYTAADLPHDLLDPKPLFQEEGAVLYRVRDPEGVRAWFLELGDIRQFREKYRRMTESG
ncbi:MAG: hypothetical protein ACE5H3_07565 [Planctomycetota bacterium]